MVDLTDRIIGVESGGNPNARNPLSSAGGSGQFINSTWLSTIKKHRPDLAAGKSDTDLLRLKFDPAISREMTAAYASDNQNFLRSRGVPVNDGSTYLAHWAGPAGAAALYANPQATVEATLGHRVVAANPNMRGKTGQDAINWASNKMSPSQFQAAALRKKFGTDTAGGVSAPAAAASPASTERLKSALAKYNPDMLAAGQEMRKQGQAIATSYGNRTGALGGTLVAGLGGLLEGSESAAKKEHDAALSDALLNSGGAKQTIGALLASSDPEYRKAGVELLIKAQTAKPAEVKPIEIGGRLVMPQADGSYKEVYAAPEKPAAVPDDVQKYQFDMQQRKAAGQPEISYADWRKATNSDAAFSKNVIWGTKDGQPALIQPGSEGKAVLTELPEGFSLAKDPIKVDAGTHWSIIDPQTRQEINRIPKDIAGESSEKKIGEARGQAIVDLPRVEGATNVLTSKIDQVANDPYLPSMTGPLQGRLPNLSGDASRVQSRLDQLTGDAFLQAFGELKGAGAITEVEGAKAEKAKSRLATMTVNDPEYPVALKDFRDEVIRLRDLARQRAAVGTAPAASSASGGAVNSLKSKYGLE